MKHLKLFNNESEHQSFTESADYVTPNVCAVKDGQGGVKKDFVFFNPEEEINVNLITFYIGDTPYQCEDGMTWEEFVNSNYNSEGLFQISGDRAYYNQDPIAFNDTAAHNTDTILNDYKYLCYKPGGGID